MANKNFDGHTMGDFKSFYQNVSGDGNLSKAEAEAYVTSVFGENGVLTDDIAKKYGYDSAQSMMDTFYDELSTMGTSWNGDHRHPLQGDPAHGREDDHSRQEGRSGSLSSGSELHHP